MARRIEQAPFQVHATRRFALEEAAEAHRAVGEHRPGKLVLSAGD